MYLRKQKNILSMYTNAVDDAEKRSIKAIHDMKDPNTKRSKQLETATSLMARSLNKVINKSDSQLVQLNTAIAKVLSLQLSECKKLKTAANAAKQSS